MQNYNNPNFTKSKLTFGEFFFILGITFLGALLRCLLLSKNSLWLDEMTSMQIATQPIAHIIGAKNFDQHTPPFYYLLLHFWLKLAPHTENGLRSLSVLIDVFNILLVYRIASLMLSQNIARISAFLYATSAYAIYYAQEGRMYPLLLLLCLLTLLCALEFSKQHKFSVKRQLLILATLIPCGIVGLYTHYYYALFLFALTISLIPTFKINREFTIRWISALFVMGVCFLPWLKVIFKLSQSGGQAFRTSSFSVLPYTFFRFISGYAVMPINFQSKLNFYGTIADNISLILLFCVPFAALFTSGLILLWRKQSSYRSIILSTLLIPPALALAISLKVPMLSERYLIVIFPLFLYVCALGWNSFHRAILRNFVQLSCLCLWAFALTQYYINPSFGFTQWRDAAQFVKNANTPTLTVYVNPHYVSGLVEFYLKNSRTKIVPVPDKHPEKINFESEFWLIERMTGSTSALSAVKEKAQVQEKLFLPFEDGIKIYHVISK